MMRDKCSNSGPSSAEKPLEEKKDTFAEKLATQVIKNLQVKISSIHLRYEDDVSGSPVPGFLCASGLQCMQR